MGYRVDIGEVDLWRYLLALDLATTYRKSTTCSARAVSRRRPVYRQGTLDRHSTIYRELPRWRAPPKSSAPEADLNLSESQTQRTQKCE